MTTPEDRLSMSLDDIIKMKRLRANSTGGSMAGSTRQEKGKGMQSYTNMATGRGKPRNRGRFPSYGSQVQTMNNRFKQLSQRRITQADHMLPNRMRRLQMQQAHLQQHVGYRNVQQSYVLPPAAVRRGSDGPKWVRGRSGGPYGEFRSDTIQYQRMQQPRQLPRNPRVNKLPGQNPDTSLTVSIANERANRQYSSVRGSRCAMVVGRLSRQSLARHNARMGSGTSKVRMSSNGSIVTTISGRSSTSRRARSASRQRRRWRSRSGRSRGLNLQLQKEIAAIQNKTFAVDDVTFSQPPADGAPLPQLQFRPTVATTSMSLHERFSLLNGQQQQRRLD